MSKLRTAPVFVARLKNALVGGFRKRGINAKVTAEAVPTTRLYRVLVLAPQFKALRQSERQDLAWRIADKALSPGDQLRISMIVTLTPDEAEGK